MLLCIGLIMQTRLSYSKAMKQFVIAACAIALSLVIPIIIRKCKIFVRVEKNLCDHRFDFAWSGSSHRSGILRRHAWVYDRGN